jgi:para-nitrobenzyl esterase
VDGVVEVSGGRVRGQERSGVWVFSGIPYARSPEGPLRWRPPQPVEPWGGVRDALEFGTIAPQPPMLGGFAMPGEPDAQGEDCLSLNVWTPALDAGRRPVMVWIHGGGFTSGSGAGLMYRGGDLARNGDVVVVTVNYRLGALGFLGHPALVDGDAAPAAVGNWGLLDQVAALRWVRDHVAAFGGDPGQVTIFGESAGGMSVSALLAAPSARGLFHRAIIQSGPVYVHSLGRAARAGEDLAEVLGLAEVSRRALEAVPAPELVAAAQQLQDRAPSPGELPLPFLPVVDGAFLPRHPAEAVEAGEAAHVPLMIGTNRDELTFFGLGDPRMADMDEELLLRWFGRAVPDVPAAEVVESYRSAREARGEPTGPRDLWVAAGSDLVFRWPSLQIATAQRAHQPATFVYLFTWASPAFGGLLGSCHALELPFVFGAVRHDAIASFAGGGPEALALSARMQRAWLSFARTGDPSHDDIGEWPGWDAERRATMVFGAESGAVDAPRDEELAVWSGLVPLA